MKTWIKPSIKTERFVSSSYVSACYDFNVQLQCAIPGTDPHRVDDGIDARRIDGMGMNHTICGNMSSVFSVSGDKGFETVNGTIDTTRPISNVKIGAPATGYYTTNIGKYSGELKVGDYQATWTSTDGRTGNYYHYGIAKVSEPIVKDPVNANHS